MKLKTLENTAVHCKTRQEYDRFMELANQAGWDTQFSPYFYGDKHCIKVSETDCTFAPLKFYQAEGFRVLSLLDFLRAQNPDTPTLEELKAGDWMEVMEDFSDEFSGHNRCFRRGEKYRLSPEYAFGAYFVELPCGLNHHLWSGNFQKLRKCAPPEKEAVISAGVLEESKPHEATWTISFDSPATRILFKTNHTNSGAILATSGDQQPLSPASADVKSFNSPSPEPMAEIKPGQIIEITETFDQDGYQFTKGERYTVSDYTSCSWIALDVSHREGDFGDHQGTNKCERSWCITKTHNHQLRPISFFPNLIMSVSSFLKDKARSPEDRTLIRAGFTDDCGNLSCEGKEALQSLLFAEFKPQLVSLAKEMVAEREKEAKKGCCK